MGPVSLLGGSFELRIGLLACFEAFGGEADTGFAIRVFDGGR